MLAFLFHAHSTSMAAITPPPIIAQIHAAPPHLKPGDEMDFTLWFGPLPLRWLARIESVNDTRAVATQTLTGFADRQIHGPFQHWLHRHIFEPIDDTTTAIIDEIELKPKPHPLWGLIGLGMWLTLPLLFAFRRWKTRRLLEA